MKPVPKEKQHPPIQIGSPLSEFQAALEALISLQEQGKYQVFLVRENLVRLIGDSDEFRIFLIKRSGNESIDGKKAQAYLEEIQTALQLMLAVGKAERAVQILESSVYDDEFESAKNNEELKVELRTTIRSKLDLVSAGLVTETLTERSKRLSTVSGPMLEDLDVEIISKRHSFTNGVDLKTPFLRIKVRYAVGGKSNFPFAFPPWVTNPPRDTSTFELECDETDIDVLISRLLQAKEILRNSIDDKVTTGES